MHTHIYFLLDRTGSMNPMVDDVVGGFNTFLAEQRAEGDDARMTLVQFDSQDPFEVIADAVRLAKVPELTAATFQPRGMTPLLDATGELIAHASKRVEMREDAGKKPESIVVVTFTDGEENASHRFTAATIKELVADKEALGWTFVFLGAGLDAYGESRGIGYSDGSVQAWAPDGVGVSAAMISTSKAMSSHRSKVRRGERVDSKDFFEGDKEAELDRRRRRRGDG